MKRNIFATLAAAAMAVATLSGSLFAQSFSGAVETRFGWQWSSSELMARTQILEGKVEGKAGDPDNPSAQYSALLKAEFDPSSAQASVRLGEAWIKLFAGPFDLSFGNQVVAWSVSDAFWPSDVVNPQDLSLPVDPVKMPVPLARIVLNGGAISLDLVAQPYWIASITPGAMWLPAPSPLLLGSTDPSPAFTWNNVAYGGHLKASLDLLQGLDLGATFYRGKLSILSPVLRYSGPVPVGIDLVYDRATVLGADLVVAAGGGLLVKTEWAYKTLNDSSLIEPQAGEASLQGVSGFEYRIGPVQLICEYVLDWKKGAPKDSYAHSAVGILSWDIGSRLGLKLAAIHGFGSGSASEGSGVIAPRLSYTLADGLKLEGDLFFFYGASDTTYGAWDDNSLGEVSLRYSF